MPNHWSLRSRGTVFLEGLVLFKRQERSLTQGCIASFIDSLQYATAINDPVHSDLSHWSSIFNDAADQESHIEWFEGARDHDTSGWKTCHAIRQGGFLFVAHLHHCLDRILTQTTLILLVDHLSFQSTHKSVKMVRFPPRCFDSMLRQQSDDQRSQLTCWQAPAAGGKKQKKKWSKGKGMEWSTSKLKKSDKI